MQEEKTKEKEMAKGKRKRINTFTNFLLPVSVKATSYD